MAVNGFLRTLIVAAGCLVMPALAMSGVMTLEEAEKRRQEEAAAEAQRRAEQLAPLYEAVEFYRDVAADLVPGLVNPLIDYASTDVSPAQCDQRRPAKTYAVLVGPGRSLGSNIPELAGPANDVDLVASLLPQMGVDPANVHTFVDGEATRDGLRATLLDVLDKVGCDDRVLLHFSARSLYAPDFLHQAVRTEPYRAQWEALNAAGFTHEEIAEALAGEKPPFDPERGLFVESVFGGPMSDVGIMLDDERPDFHEIVLGRDISEYMVAIRNRGAHAFASLDILYAAAADLQARQYAAAQQSDWSFEFSRVDADAEPRIGNVLLPGHGDFAVFYAGAATEMTPELRLPRDDPEARVFGLFTYHLASALSAEPLSTPRSVAESIRRSYEAEPRIYAHPRIDASDPDIVLIAEAVRAQVGEGAIRILSPTPKRGAMAVERQEIEVEGYVDWPVRTLGVHIDQTPAQLDGVGRFRGKVQLKNGLNKVSVVAVTADSRLHPFTLEFIYEGDRKALEGEGRRIAVVIANQTYGNQTGFASLATPFADAEALTEILTKTYGFETEIRSANGTTVPLVLKDPTKRQIEVALHHVGKSVGDKDTVLVFYAGHGIFEPVTSTAYWVPSDAEAGFEPSYLSAADISAAIQRMQAGRVILISDSCYSGALLRGGPPEAQEIGEAQRMQALLTLQSRRSRIVITSGNNEPVQDLGGDGHSIFARALLTGLEKMEHEAFSARELFDGYILQAVTANADQEPQYRPLEKVGHEGGDFVFVKVHAEEATVK